MFSHRLVNDFYILEDKTLSWSARLILNSPFIAVFITMHDDVG